MFWKLQFLIMTAILNIHIFFKKRMSYVLIESQFLQLNPSRYMLDKKVCYMNLPNLERFWKNSKIGEYCKIWNIASKIHCSRVASSWSKRGKPVSLFEFLQPQFGQCYMFSCTLMQNSCFFTICWHSDTLLCAIDIGTS